MQVSQIMIGDPTSVKNQLTTLAATNQIQIVQKTVSAGSFIVISDDAAPTGQTIVVIVGDPNTLADQINVIIGGGGVIEIAAPTFSAANYLVVYS